MALIVGELQHVQRVLVAHAELRRDGHARDPQAVEHHLAGGRDLGDQRLVEAPQLRVQLDRRAGAGTSFPT